MKCPTCGAENDAANRFCDQCGTRLDAPAPGVPAQAVMAAQPTAAAPVCPRCGSAVLPGEAFCDECGAPLGAAATPAGYDAPTVLAPPTAAAPTADRLVCPQCGRENMPGDRFCDNCGAALTAPPTNGAAQAPASSSDEIPTVVPDQRPAPAGQTADAEATTVVPDTPATDLSEIPTAAPDELPSMARAPVADAQAVYEEQRRQLEEAIAKQQQVVAQLEAVQQALGAATPAGVLQSLDDARAALARTQAELDALTGGAPAPAAAPTPAAAPAPAPAPA
ncbi:MAG TPA: zinc-ribbon domain-containing protein, partial [Roseiflexaceae bacterium]|nr:zinc-ribbon domain-containing protein [Roseiflexaceae bacterium]